MPVLRTPGATADFCSRDPEVITCLSLEDFFNPLTSDEKYGIMAR